MEAVMFQILYMALMGKEFKTKTIRNVCTYICTFICKMNYSPNFCPSYRVQTVLLLFVSIANLWDLWMQVAVSFWVWVNSSIHEHSYYKMWSSCIIFYNNVISSLQLIQLQWNLLYIDIRSRHPLLQSLLRPSNSLYYHWKSSWKWFTIFLVLLASWVSESLYQYFNLKLL